MLNSPRILMTMVSDTLLTQVMRMVVEKQNSKAIRYDHEVLTSTSIQFGTPFNTSLSMICDGLAFYRLPESTESAINAFAAKHRIPMEVTSSSEHVEYSLRLSLSMFATEYNTNNQHVTLYHLLLMDFAAILRHRRFLGFEQKHLLGITGCYTRRAIAYYLTFYLYAG
ncbi:uncharacterized protein BT62DRAFT_45224 [Guyanagaster necrorhizus]|uniref:Uncharacterized protein n=1 Tax=Guyanagaster necrorhizus TaxID=856835 RepID=A0A9P8B0G2_9AGAR|nr:uncharacterized protein BT62DRAFT_45224 [Guyanagaster necrorhizus MCA 3950]KAG7453067.1 hypothetical protein BT62DRAFT_45224 [Guyanagaster necrorhizus MCA 3950]